MRRAVLVLAAATALVSAGCESTQEKSARLEAEAAKLAQADPNITIGAQSKVVKVGETAVLRDQNGAAAVVELRNTGKEALSAVPVLVDVQGKGGESLFKNDLAGTEPSLISAALLPPGEELFWVNDQVVLIEQPSGIDVTVGADAQPVAGEPPQIELTEPRLEQDPVSGLAAVGRITNKSQVEQRQLVIYAVGRKDGEIVAAGRGQVPKLKAGADAAYTVFFIGDVEGAELTLAAPPTVLDPES